MRNPNSPTLDEIREWAFDTGADEPQQDWDLILTWQADEGYVRLFIELGSDPDCPKWRYFIDLLYFIIGYGVRRGRIPDEQWWYARFIELSRGYKDPYIKRWRHRARKLIESPDTYDESEWYSNRYPYEAAS